VSRQAAALRAEIASLGRLKREAQRMIDSAHAEWGAGGVGHLIGVEVAIEEAIDHVRAEVEAEAARRGIR
jgi:hypothetical protein